VQLHLTSDLDVMVCYFRTVFDVDIEAFQEKPWRQHGVDLTDYFNFGLDEESWRKYCFDMVGFNVLLTHYFVHIYVIIF
jgi:hypothetical protein